MLHETKPPPPPSAPLPIHCAYFISLPTLRRSIFRAFRVPKGSVEHCSTQPGDLRKIYKFVTIVH
jgi:hypothetical protein